MSSVRTIESASGSDRLSRRSFQRLADLVSDYSGIKMPPNKQTMLEGRLRRRIRATGHPTLEDYCAYLFNEDGLDSELVDLIDVITTNKTDFFREPKHFEFLRQRVLPERRAAGETSIRIWSAACSIGAEPYTIAMVIEDFAAAHPPFGYFILATDLSTDALAEARKGIYPTSMIQPVPADFRRRYVCEGRTPGSHYVRIAAALRSKVGFARLNFMDDHYPVGKALDVIFCRNALIYFDKPTQANVLRRLCDCLAPGGILFIGHSESITGFNLPLRTVANTIFQKI
jgi:chemotaxis protein methyltransferase CheR